MPLSPSPLPFFQKLFLKILPFFSLVFCLPLSGQPLYPKGYFQFPYLPGTKASLTGNMGELRSNHFHGGLDIRTNYVVGKPIVAAADGYVTLIQQDSHGYGNMLILRHNNGLSTVYAHLQNFDPTVEAYLRRKQYDLEQFKVEITPPKGMFRFRKGEVIGLGGNTGSSGGPHLHFEIRDSLDGIYNPLIVGFPEVEDRLPPYFIRMAIRPLDINGRVNGKYDRVEIGVKKVGKRYRTEKPIEVWGTVGLEAMVRDRINNGSSRASINCIDIKLDGKEVYFHNLAHLPLAEAKQINNHLVYDNYVRTGDKYQKCYLADGNMLHQFRTAEKTGRITIKDSMRHEVLIHVSDAYGNSTDLEMTLIGKRPRTPAVALTAGGPKARFRHELQENVLKIKATNLRPNTNTITIGAGKRMMPCPLAYNEDLTGVFLWDIRKGLPDSLVTDNGRELMHFKAVMPSSKVLEYKGQHIEMAFGDEVLYDTLYLEIKEDIEEKAVSISNGLTPLHGPLMMGFRPFDPVADPEKTGVAQVMSKDRVKFVGGRWAPDGSIKFRTKYFGKYKLVSDTKGPSITKVAVGRKILKFVIGDNLSGIHSWRGTLNGQWLLFCYEHKYNVIWAEPLIKGQPFIGDLVLEVKDNLGNISRYETSIK